MANKGISFWIFIGAVLVASYWAFKEYYPPIEMDPIETFVELCEDETLSRYGSKDTGEVLELGEVWERHLSMPETLIGEFDDEVSRFDYQQFLPEITWINPRGVQYKNLGFYDASDTIKFRSRLTEVGEWSYSISLNGNELEKGAVSVAEVSDLNAQVLPIKIDPSNPNSLVTGAEPFYWVGGKWFAAQNMAPCSIWQYRNLRASQQRSSDQEYIDYLDYLVATNHNSILLKIAVFPLMNDGISWDTLWLQRIEWGVREALARGLYVQLNIFDTWSRDRRFKVLNTTDGAGHVFNVWEPEAEDLRRIKNYLTTLVARFSAYPNLFWELGNEMEHKPNCGECFVKNANLHYLPMLRDLDPYDHLIGLSESVWLDTNVDVGFLHQTREIDFHDLPIDSRPMVLNELVFSDFTQPLWKDETIRDKSNRLAFRRAFWRAFIFDTAGSFEATWLSIQESLSDPVRKVMEDHGRLAQFIESENINVNERTFLGRLPSGTPRFETYGMSLPDGRHYFYMLSDSPERPVRYWSLEFKPDTSIDQHYAASWYNPETGEVIKDQSVTQVDRIARDRIRIRLKYQAQDMVLILRPVSS